MDPKPRKHVPDLKELLLDAALSILAEKDTPLGLRKVAERAGKSRTAPYLVFGKKQDGGGLPGLKLAIATRGTNLLHSAILSEISSIADPRESLEQATRTFLSFANKNPRLFRLMFGPEVAEISTRSVEDSAKELNPLELIKEQPELESLVEARTRLETVLKNLIEECQEAGYLPDSDLKETLLTVARGWMSLHGTASLMLDPVYRSFVPLTLNDFTGLAIGAILGPGTADDGMRDAAIYLLAAQRLREVTDTMLLDDSPPPALASPFAQDDDHIQDDFFASSWKIDEGVSMLEFGGGDPPNKRFIARKQFRDRLNAQSSEARETIESIGVLRRALLTGGVLKGSNVLWIDDHTESISPEKQTLEALGVGVLTAETTAQGLEILASRSIDLILSDIDRSGDPNEGVLAIPYLKKIAPETPIIFYVGQIEPDKGIPQGAAGITNQPDELLHLVLDQLERVRV